MRACKITFASFICNSAHMQQVGWWQHKLEDTESIAGCKSYQNRAIDCKFESQHKKTSDARFMPKVLVDLFPACGTTAHLYTVWQTSPVWQDHSFCRSQINIWDVGGQKSLRSYWRNYFEQTDALIWVVDSADTWRLEDCKSELHNLLKEERLAGATLLVLANKQDQLSAKTAQQIQEVCSESVN